MPGHGGDPERSRAGRPAGRAAMRQSLLMGSSLVMIALFVGWVPAAQSQSYDEQDLSGYWRLRRAVGPPWAPDRNTQFATEIPLQPWAQEHCRRVGCGRGTDSAGTPWGTPYLQSEDPALIRCAPRGFPRILLNGGPMEIVPIPQRLWMRFYLNNEKREIWMDGREHPEDPQRPWTRHSIGHWDGDTLVVDTVGLIGGQDGQFKWLDHAGYPHSDDLHVVERILRTDADTLEFNLLFDDPRAFTAPIRGRVTYGRYDDPEELAIDGPSVEYVRCEDQVYADQEVDAWPFFTGEYPEPQFPPAGP